MSLESPTTYEQQQRDSQNEPDSDAIKMFVGQIPRTWNEAECHKLLDEFGPIHQLNVLKDKNSTLSKGCCFVTFCHRSDALQAQKILHNNKILPQMQHPVQIKPADCENRNERKLFVGMLNRSMEEKDVIELLKECGQIEECTVLREEGRSKGCAFVTFVSRACALQAIRKMHHSQTLEGCSKPLVVKFADTPKEKETKKTLSLTGGTNPAALTNPLLQLPNQSGINNTNLLTSQLLNLNALLQQPALLPIISSVTTIQQQQQISALLQQQKLLELLKQVTAVTSSATSIPSQQQHQQQAATADLLSRYQSTINQSPTNDLLQQLTSLQQRNAYSQFGGLLNNNSGGSSSSSSNLLPTSTISPSILNDRSAASISPHGTQQQLNNQSKGPDGCNLFIYHLPQDFTDTELQHLFGHFGNVLSSKVFIDKQTNLSKCFGFVSYDNILSAQNAISAMNGFQIGSKRLKVQVKRNKDKPYQRPT